MAGRKQRASVQLDRARALLRDQPTDPVPLARDIKRQAEALGISMATLARARRQERILTTGGRGPGSSPRWLRRTTPYRPRMATLSADRFGIDCAAYASAPDSYRVLWNPSRTYQILTRALAGEFDFRLEKNQAPEPTPRDRRFRYYYRSMLSCLPLDVTSEDWDGPRVVIQYGPADRNAAAFRVKVFSDMQHLLDLTWVDTVLLRLTEALSPSLSPRRANAFWQLVYLETTFDIPLTDASFEDLLPSVKVDGIDDAGTDIWPWQDYVQYGSPKSSRFAALYDKTEQALAAVRAECRFRRAYLEEKCGIVTNDDLRRVGFAKLYHLRLPEPFESRRLACTDAYEAAIREGRSGAPRCVPRYISESNPRPATDHPIGEKLIRTQTRRMINSRLERSVGRPVLDRQERLAYMQAHASTLAATLRDFDASHIDALSVPSFRKLLTQHIRRLCEAERATISTAEYPAIVSMLDASTQARHALKRWRRSMSLTAAESVRERAQAYLDVVRVVRP